MKAKFLLLLLASMWLCGCATYQYRITQPAPGGTVTNKQPVALHYDPLDYHFSTYENHLVMNIANPTDDRIGLQGGRSFVVDPKGESHPLRDRVIAPHSFTRMLLPPIPFSYPYSDYWAWGPRWGYWGPGWYDPFWGGWYGPWAYGPPPVSYAQVVTVFDWEWKTGPARLRLTYERNGKRFEHDLEIIREEAK
jgi:hypothetical protein